jgi:hypothetical protein
LQSKAVYGPGRGVIPGSFDDVGAAYEKLIAAPVLSLAGEISDETKGCNPYRLKCGGGCVSRFHVQNMEAFRVTNCQKKKDGRMSSVAMIAKELIGVEKARRSVKTEEARKIVARQIGVAPGALERLLAGRLVHIERISDRINQYVAKRLETQIATLEHEIQIARRMSMGVEPSDIERAEAALEIAKKALRND